MSDPRIEKLAHVLAHYSLKVKRGDLVRIAGPALAEPLFRAMFEQVLEAGAYPFVRVMLQGQEELYYRRASDDQLKFISEIDKLEMERVDATLTILGKWNTRELTSVDPQRIRLRREATRDLQHRFLERAAKGELRWCGTQYPSHAEAQDAEMSLSEYEDKSLCILSWRGIKITSIFLSNFLFLIGSTMVLRLSFGSIALFT